MGDPMDQDSDSDVEFQTSEEDQEAIMQLESALETNPRQMKLHLKLVALLRKCQLAQRLRSARVSLRELYPLSPEMWQEWLNDETSALQSKLAALASGNEVDQEELEEDQDFTLQLFEAATAEYLIVDTWLQYLQFVMSLNTASADNAEDTVSRVREVGEKALTAAGLHMSQASRLWDAYRAYEQALADAGWGGASQDEKVRNLFQRQLKVPLVGMDSTMEAYKAWEATKGNEEVPANIQQAYDSAVMLLEIRMPLEEMLGAPSAGEDVVYTAYSAYLKTEEATSDPARISYMFERAVAALPRSELLWRRYTAYVEHNIKNPDTIQSVLQRAARNCYASGAMWARYLRAVERLGMADDQLDQVYTAAMENKLKSEEDYIAVILARCDSLRRQGADVMPLLREVFKEGAERLVALNPQHCDQELRLPAYHAHCEAELAGDMKAARLVWEEALKASTGRLASTWQAYISWERSKRNIQEARALYRRVYSRKLEEMGSAEDFFNARMKLEPLLEDISPAKALSAEEIRRMRQSKDPNFKKATAGREDSAEVDTPPAKRTKVTTVERPIKSGPPPGQEYVAFVNQLPKFIKAVAVTKFFASCPGLKDVRMPLDHMTGKPRGLAYIEFESQEGLDAAMAMDGQMLEGQPIIVKRSDRQSGSLPPDADDRVAFCRNLSWHTNEDGLRQLFADCPGLKAIRIPLDHATGRVRGIAYVEFENDEGLDAAVKLSGTYVDGRPVMIEHSAPKPGGGGGGGGRGRGRGGRGFYDGGRGRGRGYGDYGGGGRYGGPPSYGGASYGAPVAPMDPSMSNDQFRHMFLGPQ
eukprot:CAMPEP_0117672452 /NCGR_PEP_ID=MMETSP0804-20121206/13912_1 /TAXON_ID=1074897 /ORGANISM="Tetraselmis astigmatica, Strain CCMP880" /LENGTH=815 /DNA_ID=CAMNT_0005481055 /DNA_START=71 /DNA_END=2519 /DNA_ORIENTATION=-